MLRRSLAVLLSAFVPALVPAFAQASQNPTAAPAITWQPDFAAARALAKQTGKPLLVTFRCER